jgi:transglutaminase superfamily protein
VLAAAALVGGMRLALRLLPYATVQRIAMRLGRPHATIPLAVSRVAWAVAAAGRRVPGGANCLAQALAALVLLRRHGHHGVIRLGVAYGAGRQLEAHAWLEHEGAVLVGSAGVSRYTALPATAGDVR